MTLQGSSDGAGENERDEGILKDEYFLTDDFYEYEQGQADIIVKDRLRKHIQFWREIGTDPFILDIIENGYVIQFHSTPNSMFSKNNKSALQNEEFVLEAIKDLEIKGLIERCSERPYVVNPLTVSVQNSGKKRLILDIRLVNKHLWKRCVRFEDLEVALNFLYYENCWMIKFDIHSAYHYISIRENQTTFLGFSWKIGGKDVFFKLLVLPFGLRSAPYHPLYP